MDVESLIETLCSLELALHQPEVRSNPADLDRLLHPRFREFGRCGRIYERAEVIAELCGQSQSYEVRAQGFQIAPLSDVIALLTYQSAHLVGNGELEHCANRASLWQRTDVGWQILFHQGTPTETLSGNAT
jgi:hypothetical protein